MYCRCISKHIAFRRKNVMSILIIENRDPPPDMHNCILSVLIKCHGQRIIISDYLSASSGHLMSFDVSPFMSEAYSL